MKENKNIREILRFLVGGGSAVLTDFLTYRLLVYAGLDVSPSKAISYVLGAGVGFLINKFWTFESKQFRPAEIVLYILLYACSACINTVSNKLVLQLTGMTVLAFLAATGISTVINFIGQKFLVFRK